MESTKKDYQHFALRLLPKEMDVVKRVAKLEDRSMNNTIQMAVRALGEAYKA